MNKKTIIVLIIIFFISFPKISYVYADVNENEYTKTMIPLDDSYKYSENSKIKSDSATLYTSKKDNKKNITVCINAGHGTSGGSSVKTLCHPDGTPKVTGGTTAAGETYAPAVSSGMSFSNGTPEAEATLGVALKLKELLLEDGYNVLMIRETSDIQLDNIARTVIANNNADCHVSLHFDDTASGAYYTKVPSEGNYKDMEPVKSNWQNSDKLGESILNALQSKGDIAVMNPPYVEMDLTQTSYSTIPSMDIELGNGQLIPSDALYQKLAEGVYSGIAKFFNENPNLTNGGSNSNSSQSSKSKKKGSLFDDFFRIFFEIIGVLYDILRTVFGDLPQMVIDFVQTVPLGTWKDYRITYTYSQLEADGDDGGKNRFTKVSEGSKNAEYTIYIDGTEEEFSKKTEIPVIPADLYNFANGSVKLFNTNIFEKKENRGVITNIVFVIVRVIIFILAAYLIFKMVLLGIYIVWSANNFKKGSEDNPQKEVEYKKKLIALLKATIMLIVSIIVMALSIYFMKLLFSINKISETDELPIRVNVGADANYSFSTNGIGYFRYMSQLASSGLENLMEKIIYTRVYIFLVILNLLVLLIMVIRYIFLMYLTIIGPIVATFSVDGKKKILGMTYKEWLVNYLIWTSIQVILAILYSLILKLGIKN